MPIVPTKKTKAERYTSPITGEQRYFEVNRTSHRVTDRQLKRSVKRVYGNNKPSKADRGVAARTVYPAHPNVKQLRNWEKNPGRVDIKGIDAPKDAAVTARRTVTIPRNVQRQIGVRSANAKRDFTKVTNSGHVIYKVWESFGQYNVLAQNPTNGEWVFGRDYDFDKGYWQGGRYRMDIEKLYNDNPPYGQLVIDNHVGPCGRY